MYDAAGVSYVNFTDDTKSVFRMEAKKGIFGKESSDTALGITNTSEQVTISGFSSGDSDERYHGIRVEPGDARLTADDTYVFKTEFAVETLNSIKKIKASAYLSNKAGAALPDLLSVDTNGNVTVLGMILRENGQKVAVIPQKWYNLKVVLRPSDGTSSNTVDVYWDGRLLLENQDFQVDGYRTEPFGGFSLLEVGYDIRYSPLDGSGTLSDGNYSQYNVEGFYLDNIKGMVYQGCEPELAETDIKSDSLYYANTIAEGEGVLYTYGQDIPTFLSKLNVSNMESAAFVSSGGTVISNGNADSADYLRIKTTGGDSLYLKTELGEDEYLASLEDINTESKWNRDLDGFYVYEQPDITKLKGSALDASSVLDGPAGKYGFVQRDGDEFVCVNETTGVKTPIRFWGTNIGGSGAFPETHEEAELIADSIAAAGFNLVRIHNIDGSSTPNVFGNANSGKALDATQMEKLCYLLSEFKERGIYYFIDQTCSRKIYPDDGLTETDVLGSRFGAVCYYDEDIIGILEDYSEMLLSYENPYTGMALKDDPAMACIDFNNETTLLTLDIDAIRGSKYYTEYKKMYNDWLAEKYPTRAELEAAWSVADGYMTTGLETGEDQTLGTVELTNLGIIEKSGVTTFYTTARSMDEQRFAGYITDKYFARRIEHLRGLGIKCAITGNTSFGDVMPEVWYSNSKTDFVDTHIYWSHRADGEDLLTPGIRFNTNTRFKDAATGEAITGVTSTLKAAGLGYIGQMATSRIYGMPYTISEWKECPANPYLGEGPLLVAAYGSLQGWNPLDFVFESETNLFTQIQNGAEIGLSDVFASAENPTLRAIYPSVATMFLREDVAEATSGYYHNYTDNGKTENDIYYVGRKENAESFSDRIWVGRHFFPELGNYGLIGKTGVSFLHEDIDSVNDTAVKTAADAAQNGDMVYSSQTGELVSDLKNGIFTMNTEKSGAVCGFIGGKEQSLNGVDIKVDNEFATVTVISLSDKSLEQADRILLTMVGNSLNYGQLLSEDGSILKKAGSYPIMVEQITGEIELKLSGEYEVYPLTSSGERKAALTVTKTTDGFKFNVTTDVQATNFEIIRQ